MGQKVNPHGLRVGVIKDWDSRWYYKLRQTLKKQLYNFGISKIEIERDGKKVKISIHTAKPGLVIGKGGAEIEKLKAQCEKMLQKPVAINIVEVKAPELDAQLTAESIAQQLEKRISFRRAMKQSIGNAMRRGAKGIKIMCSGRLGGAEIARSEQYHEGTIPLQTLRADIEYGFAEANTTYGKVGVKVWLYKGEVLNVSEDKPRRVKYRRVHRGRMTGKALRGNTVTYGQYGLQACEPGWITSNQIEAARIAMTRYCKRFGKVWIKIFPDKPVTARPAETRMGKGKGNVEYWVAVVKPQRVMFELAGVDEATAREALRLASHKLPVKCKFVKKEEGEQ